MASEAGGGDLTVVFVCQHGALRSRLAAAFFNVAGPAGWHAVSVGIQPQGAVSEAATRLLKGTEAETLLDTTPPRPLDAVPGRNRIVAIDCEVAGAERWDLMSQEVDFRMRDELRQRVQALARDIRRHLP